MRGVPNSLCVLTERRFLPRLGATLAERKTLQPATTGAAFKSTGAATILRCAGDRGRCSVGSVSRGLQRGLKLPGRAA